MTTLQPRASQTHASHERLEDCLTYPAVDPAEFRRVLGSYPTGVSLVTAKGPDGMPIGMIVGSFTSVSLDPPLVGFLPDKKSSTWPKIEAAGRFCVNVLASDQRDLCRQAASKDPNKFAGINHSISHHGLPVIADAIAWIECAIHNVIEAGDHWMVLGRVLALEIVRSGDPMLFHGGRYGGFAEYA